MSRGRKRAVRALIVFGSVLAFLSVFAIWIERQALNTDDWVATSGRLLQNQTIRTALSNYLVDQLYENVDVRKELEEILPGEAKELAGPAAGGLRQVAGQGAEKVLETSTAQELWEDANRSHARTAAGGAGKQERSGPTAEGNVTLNLGSLLTNLAEQVGIGESLAEKLPPDAAQIHDPQVRPAEDGAEHRGRGQGAGAAALDPHLRRLWRRDLPLARRALGHGAAQRRRPRRRRLCSDRLPSRSPAASSSTSWCKNDSVKPAGEAAWSIGTSLMTSIATTVIVVGALFLAAGWLASPTGGARGVRRYLAPVLRLHPAYVYSGAGDRRLHLLPQPARPRGCAPSSPR